MTAHLILLRDVNYADMQHFFWSKTAAVEVDKLPLPLRLLEVLYPGVPDPNGIAKFSDLLGKKNFKQFRFHKQLNRVLSYMPVLKLIL